MNNIKSTLKFIKEYPKLSLMILVLFLVAIRMAHQNYSIQSPIVNKRSESYIDVWNGRAACLTQLDQYSTNQQNNNQ